MNKKYTIIGPAVRRAFQEGVKSRKDTVVVVDRDSSGTILRVGYVLAEKGKNPKGESIKWFKEGQYRVVAQDQRPSEVGRVAEVELTYQSPAELQKQEKTFLMVFGLGRSGRARFRYLFRVRKNAVNSFVIQVEAKDEQEVWKAVVRYDCAHGFIHRDLLSKAGEKMKKRMDCGGMRDAIEKATGEIGRDFRKWLTELGYERTLSEFSDQLRIDQDLRDAKDFLQDLVDDPKKLPQVSSTFRQVKDAADLVEIL